VMIFMAVQSSVQEGRRNALVVKVYTWAIPGVHRCSVRVMLPAVGGVRVHEFAGCTALNHILLYRSAFACPRSTDVALTY
jgi:hypothetical protein